MAWQSEPGNPTLIECKIGGQTRDKDTGEIINHPTKYRAAVMPLLHQTLDNAKANPYYNPADPGPARGRAAAWVWKREGPQLGGATKRNRGPNRTQSPVLR